MELRLTKGLYTASNASGLEIVTGIEEVAQRIVMKLCARRGGFALMPDYGSRLHLLTRLKPSELRLAAEQYVMEALMGETSLTLLDLETGELNEGHITLKLYFQYKTEKITVETRV